MTATTGNGFGRLACRYFSALERMPFPFHIHLPPSLLESSLLPLLEPKMSPSCTAGGSTRSCCGPFGQGPGTPFAAADRLRVSSYGQTDATVPPDEGAFVPPSAPVEGEHEPCRSGGA